MSTEDQIAFKPVVFQDRYLPLRRLDPPAAGVVHLWHLDLARLGSPLSQHDDPGASLTSRQERTVRRFYLRLLLGAYLHVPGKQVTVSRMVKGKPVLDSDAHQQNLDFSMAGSDACCLIGVCTAGLIGVDLERAGRATGNPAALARRYFSSREAAALGALGKPEIDRAFLHTWACKEAVVKAAGHGIANQLCRFTVNTDPASRPEVLHMMDDTPSAWRLACIQPSASQLGAVALRHATMKIEGFRLRRTV